MKERVPGKHYTDRVRDYSCEIVDKYSGGILSIDTSAVENELAGELRYFQKLESLAENSFATYILSPENELGTNLFFNVINFCYRNPYTQNDYVYTDKAWNKVPRSIGLKAAMNDAEINWGNTREVSKLTPKQWSEIIQLENNRDFYLGEDRGKRIAEMAGKMADIKFNNISDFLDYAEYDTEIILPILSKCGYFYDEFQKRSQLAVSMMNGVLKSRFGREFSGLDSLTVMADYRLPQVMYNFGAIELSQGLKDKLMNQEVIDTDSPEEISLRAASVVIGERLSKLMGINESEVDQLLWSLAHEMAKENRLQIHHMLVATDKY